MEKELPKAVQNVDYVVENEANYKEMVVYEQNHGLEVKNTEL